MENRESFIVYRSFVEAILDLPEENQLNCFKALFEYGLDEKFPEKGIERSMLILMKPNIDRAKQRHDAQKQNGKQGGRPKKNKEENPSETEEEANITDNNTEIKEVSEQFNNKVTHINKIDYEFIQKQFNSICVGLPSVKVLSDKRKKDISRAEKRLNKIDSNYDLIMYFETIASIPFLNGKNDKGWKADFDWILKEANMLKVIEGKYKSDSKFERNVSTIQKWAGGAV